ncbi:MULTISPECIES: aminotransferase class V-fold PLP-dependent enzyme [Clostridium]|uniref:cysteine desulfurase n=1 Tax=Clostridium cibarium TaxID=2762247 RepID=A0ABR8PY52_9CLOT|nr:MULTISPECIES: aminotransferase class V-fold PLP-dependent enzyme [Clostridium]MBD7913100.1 aminotransferase class V-fold PLP-dependent enzyme [Clostridium cibarium]
MNIYLDNASTTFPKPKAVADSIYDYLINIGGNANRSNYSNSLDSSRKLLLAREKIADFFKFDKPSNIIFTNNITSSLNILLRGTLKPGDHVISSCMEHNSILRPLSDLQNLGISVDLVHADELGFINPMNIKNLIKPNTKMCVISHASNVTGSIQDIDTIGTICKDSNIFFVVDSAQSAGVLDIDINKIKANAIAFTGHKSLLGPQGTGGFVIDDKLNTECSPLLSGGTGSLSYSLKQPSFLPDKFESGTMNMPGIIGLSSGIDFINQIGINTIREKISYLRSILLDGILNIDDLTVYGDLDNKKSTTCLSINHKSLDPSEVSYFLDSNGIKTRSGLHCAPLAHKAIGTYPTGTVRLSLSYFNSETDIYNTLNILSKLRDNL